MPVHHAPWANMTVCRSRRRMAVPGAGVENGDRLYDEASGVYCWPWPPVYDEPTSWKPPAVVTIPTPVADWNGPVGVDPSDGGNSTANAAPPRAPAIVPAYNSNLSLRIISSSLCRARPTGLPGRRMMFPQPHG